MSQQQMIIRFLVIAFVLISPLIAAGQSASSPNRHGINRMAAYPIPSENPDMLFYLQRSLDLNSVIYAANYLDSRAGRRKLDSDHPVNIYWLINDKEGSTKPLTKIQKLGYGIKPESLKGDIVQIKLIAYNEMTIFLRPSLKDEKYQAHIFVQGKDILLKKIFINIDGGTKLKPNVTFIEITGTDTQTGKKIVHKFRP